MVNHLIKSVLLLTCIIPVLLFSQKVDIRGTVTDASSGEKIPYATVSLYGAQRGAVTNNNGFFLITKVPWGTYEIVVSVLGYETMKKSVTLTGERPVVVNFPLEQSPVEVSEVVVTGGRKNELTEINTSVHVLSSQEISRVPVAAQDDVLRSIQILPGIVSSADVSSKFYVRGGAADQNLIVLDGMKIYNPYHAFGIFSVFDPDILKTSEIYTGAFPAGYGGRLSSVLNMTSRDGNKKEFHGNASVNFVTGKLQLEGPLFNNRSSFLVSGRRSLFQDTFKKFVHDIAPITYYDVFAKANFDGEFYGRQSLQVFASGDDVISERPTDADYRWRTISYAYSFANLIDDNIYVNATAYATDFSIIRTVDDPQLLTPADSYIKDGGIRGELTFYTESRDLYFLGFDVNAPRYGYNFYTGNRTRRSLDDADIETWMWFRYQGIRGRIKYDAGIHVDAIAMITGRDLLSMAQPRVNISYTFENDWKTKLSYGAFSQNLITLTNEDDIVSLYEAWIFIPSTLQPEFAHHVIAGIEGNVYSELSLSVQTYYKAFTSLITYNRDKKFPTEPDYLNGTGKAYGIETLFRYGFDFIDIYFSHTLGWTTVNANGFEYSPRYDRRHSINLLNVFKFTPEFDVSLRWEFGSGYPFSQTIGYYHRFSLSELGRDSFLNDVQSPYSALGEKNAARLPAYHRLDLNATYRFTLGFLKGQIGANVVNIYNNKNILYYDRKTGQKITMLPLLPSGFVRIEL